MGGAGIVTGVFLQARIDSSRLPGKALLMIGPFTIVEHAMARLKRIPAERYVLVCDYPSVEIFRPLARRHGFEIFGGPKEDVLARFVQASDLFQVDTIVRATADNPLVSWEYGARTLLQHRKSGADYSTFTGLPIGTGVEVVQSDALRRANSESSDPYDHEHVTPYVYRSGLFHLDTHPSDVDSSLSEMRVTVDTREDYERLLDLVTCDDAGMLPDFPEVCRILLRTRAENAGGK